MTEARSASRVSQHTLTSRPGIGEKPKIPVKPVGLIRPGLKPVQIPNVDDKLGLRPRKPPRRNHSISPVPSQWESEGYEDESHICSKRLKAGKTVYSSKSGSKSFDELDDILSEKPRRQSKKRGRRTLSSISGSDLMKARERRERTEEDISCGDSELDISSCQSCVLTTISNSALAADDARHRFISQKQYKRKIRRESCAGSQQPSGYATLDSRLEKRLSNGQGTKIVSKTTYKLKKFNGATSELDR